MGYEYNNNDYGIFNIFLSIPFMGYYDTREIVIPYDFIFQFPLWDTKVWKKSGATYR